MLNEIIDESENYSQEHESEKYSEKKCENITFNVLDDFRLDFDSYSMWQVYPHEININRVRNHPFVCGDGLCFYEQATDRRKDIIGTVLLEKFILTSKFEENAMHAFEHLKKIFSYKDNFNYCKHLNSLDFDALKENFKSFQDVNLNMFLSYSSKHFHRDEETIEFAFSYVLGSYFIDDDKNFRCVNGLIKHVISKTNDICLRISEIYNNDDVMSYRISKICSKSAQKMVYGWLNDVMRTGLSDFDFKIMDTYMKDIGSKETPFDAKRSTLNRIPYNLTDIQIYRGFGIVKECEFLGKECHDHISAQRIVIHVEKCF